MKSITKRRSKYFAGLTTGYIATLLSIFVGLWLIPFILKFLDIEEYAIFTLSGDVLNWLMLIDIGMTPGLNVIVSQLTGKSERNELNGLISTTFFSQLILMFLILVIGVFVTFNFPAFFNVREDLVIPAKQVFTVLLIGLCISLSTKTFSVLLIAHQQIYIDNLLRVLLIVLRTIITVVLLIKGYGLMSLAISHIFATITISILSYIRVRKLLPTLTISTRLFSLAIFKKIFSLGIWFSLGGLAGIIILHLDRIVTGKIISLETVTMLTITSRLFQLSTTFLNQITDTARPMLGQILGEGDFEKAYKVYSQITQISTSGAILVGFVLLSINGTFINWWVGKGYYQGFWVDVALLLNLMVNCWVLPNRAVLSAAKIIKQQSICRLIEAALNLSLSVIFGYFWGIFGVLIGTTIASAITSFWYLPSLSYKFFGRNFLTHFLKDLLKFLPIFILLSITSTITLKNFNTVNGIAGILIKSTIVIIVGIFCIWILVLDKELKNTIINRIKMNSTINRLLHT